MKIQRRASALRLLIWTMKAIRLFIVAAVLAIAGVWSLFANFKGNLDIHLGWPLTDTSLQISGAATGGWTLTGILLLLGAVAAFLWALVVAIAAHMRAPVGDVPPVQPDSKA